MGDASVPRSNGKRVADRFERLDLGRVEHLEGHALRAGLPRGEQHLDPTRRKGERADRSAFDESPAGQVVHERVLPRRAAACWPGENAGSVERMRAEMNRGAPRKRSHRHSGEVRTTEPENQILAQDSSAEGWIRFALRRARE
jgi:hypothetical protein